MDEVVKPAPISLVVTCVDPTVWIADNFSQRWFEDALHEATTGTDVNSVRREIIFACCFLESYIFEWVRDIDPSAISDYFPVKPQSKSDHWKFLHKLLRLVKLRPIGSNRWHRKSLKDKWRDIPNQVFRARNIQVNRQLDLSKLGTLVKYRNGLVHATASRPCTDKQPHKEKPVPAIDELKTRKPGWALSISVTIVEALHRELGTAAPGYLAKWNQ